MKIRITESQYKKLRLISEEGNDIDQFKAFCAKQSNQIDLIYNQITHESLADLLSLSFNPKGYNDTVEKIEESIQTIERQLINRYEHTPIPNGREDDDIYLILDEVSWPVFQKINSLQSILEPLADIQEKIADKGLLKPFKNVKPIDITPISH